MPGLDLERIAQLFARRGERVVLVLPQGELIVLVPLAEYEKLVAGSGTAAAGVGPTVRRHKPSPTVPSTMPTKTYTPAANPLETVDPPQGTLTNDDQYYPEPLDG